MRRIGWLVMLIVLTACGVVPPPTPAFGGGEGGCPARDTRVTAPYAISGYWVMPRADRCVTRRMVEAIHALGGDTLVTFGPRFDAGRPDPDFDACRVDGRPCARVPGRKVRHVYTYATGEEFPASMLRCPGIDRRIEAEGRVFYRLSLAAKCADRMIDLVLVTTDGDGIGNLVEEAAAYGMTVFPGLPAAPQRPGKPWEPDLRHAAALDAFTGRVLAGYRERFGGSPAFGGVYQSFELAMRERGPRDPILALYTRQHAVVAATLPGKKILVSPYIDARRGRGFPPALASGGLADIAATRAGLPMAVAVQDGRGTGKVPVHGPQEAGAMVATRLVPVVGNVRNDQAYYAPTRDYVEAAARDVPAGVELWVNVEGFEPSPVPGECGRVDPLPFRGRTTKARLDQQIMATGGHAVKIISYGWDPFFTCQAGPFTPSLADDLASAYGQPIVVNAYRKDRDGRPGVLVEGYNLRGGALRFTTSAGRSTLAGQQWYAHGRLDSAWAPYVPEGPWTSVTATNAAGHTSTSGYVFR